ncbi:DUF1501 domain-containing protein [Grimontia sp. NTOU-MAR1]|uniref:DUF1501 domain-containing protein n=1 Tax=Grimontia sp. NTOU-MAR1 TaxID=3111011 RepID=UPI002DB796A9|nr:DUF1501 domain-containing protein [Grimontia sp. NTOU-MAR1]WRV98019.1 DUF1501 domain-containing protein [Grimontia sp. NTOU-MAR1]
MTLTRRQVIKSLGAASATAAAPLSLSVHAGGADDYKALVCVFLAGGNDFFHQVLPLDSCNYNKYASSRYSIVVSQSMVNPLHIKDANGARFGLHKSMTPLMRLFERGKANFAINVGPLLAPVTQSDIVSGRADLPPFLFAHNKQQEVWQHSWMGRGYSENGWLGMSMDVLSRSNGGMPNAFYTGPNSLLDAYNTDKIFVNRNGFESFNMLQNAAMRSSYENNANQYYDSPLTAGYADVVKQAMYAQDQMSPIIASIPMDKRIPATSLGMQLRAVKQMIEGAQMLGHNRQVFYVTLGGFDTHDNQVRRQDELMKEFAEGIAAFYTSLEEEGLEDGVLTCTLSEFGRTMHDNSRNGTDHGWGGGHFLFGGGTASNTCFGTYPDFTRGGQDDNGEGRLIPKISHEQYAAHVVKWLGLNNAALNTVFPNLYKFGGAMGEATVVAR